MGKIEEIKERLELNKHVQNLCNNPIREFDMFSSPFKSAESDIEYLLSRIQIAEEALKRIYNVESLCERDSLLHALAEVNKIAEDALEQIQKEG